MTNATVTPAGGSCAAAASLPAKAARPTAVANALGAVNLAAMIFAGAAYENAKTAGDRPSVRRVFRKPICVPIARKQPMNHPSQILNAKVRKLRKLLRRPRERRRQRRPRLRFSPTAWAKLLYLRDRGPTEVGAFGLAPADDLLHVEELRLVRQQCTAVSVSFDDAAVAEFFDEQVDRGRMPAQFARIWVHTHPGNCPLPSQVDEETFDRVFGHCDWAVMFILAKEGQTYCRLQFAQGPGGAFEIAVRVDFEREFGQSDQQAWAAEFDAAVSPEAFA